MCLCPAGRSRDELERCCAGIRSVWSGCQRGRSRARRARGLSTRSVMVWTALASLSVAWIAAGVGCATRGEVVGFRDRLGRMEAGQIELREQAARSDSLLGVTLDEIAELRVGLAGELAALADRLEIIEGKLELNRYRLSRILGNLEGLRPEGDTQNSARPGTASGDRELYDSAYIDMTRGNYDLALLGFRAYLDRYPAGELVDEARYWIGECYYALDQPDRAIEAFLEVERSASEPDRIAGALLRVALCHLDRGNVEQARRYLERVVAEHPRSDEAAVARERLKML